MEHPIRLYREQHGLSLEAFGSIVGVKKSAVSKWESGMRPSIGLAQRIEAATSIPKEVLRPDVWSPYQTGAAA